MSGSLMSLASSEHSSAHKAWHVFVQSVSLLLMTLIATTQSSGADFYSDCLASKKLSPSQCSCLIQQSNALEDNDPVLSAFIKIGLGKSVSDRGELISDLINNKLYDGYKFKTQKAREEFIKGKMALFFDQLEKFCF